jgi:hypothetical protein
MTGITGPFDRSTQLNTVSQSTIAAYTKTIEFTDPEQVEKITDIVKNNLDVIAALASDYRNRYAKLSVHKKTYKFCVDTDYLYSRDFAGAFLPNALRWYDSDIANLKDFFFFLILRINEIGKCAISKHNAFGDDRYNEAYPVSSTVATYFITNKEKIDEGLNQLQKIYFNEGKAKREEFDIVGECRNLLIPLKQAFLLFKLRGFTEENNPMKSWQLLMSSQSQELLELLKLPPFSAIDNYLTSMYPNFSFRTKFLLICLQVGIEKITPKIEKFNEILKKGRVNDNYLEINRAMQLTCFELFKNIHFKDAQFEICTTLNNLLINLQGGIVGYFQKSELDDSVKEYIRNFIENNVDLYKYESDRAQKKKNLRELWTHMNEIFGACLYHVEPYSTFLAFMHQPYEDSKALYLPLPFKHIGEESIPDFISNIWLERDYSKQFDLSNPSHRKKLLQCAEKTLITHFKSTINLKSEEVLKKWIKAFPEFIELEGFKKLKKIAQMKYNHDSNERDNYIFYILAKAPTGYL